MRTATVRSRVWTALIIVALGFLISATTTSAHRDWPFGGHFPHTPRTWLRLGFTQWGAYRDEVLAATRSWDRTRTRLVVFEEDYANSELDFFGYPFQGTWWGYGDPQPCSQGGCIYTWSNLYLNTNEMHDESRFVRQKVAAHEMGHGMGLSHVQSWEPDSIMKQGSQTYNTPRNHDVNDINAMYP
jgi:hypothetical protein